MKRESDCEQSHREIDAANRQIDQLGPWANGELYGLTADEIRIVEEAAAQFALVFGVLERITCTLHRGDDNS
jgi:hypothetical protein